ncbi:hypothetical protein [Campylobacter sp. RM16190]|uniref:hypothetical protein n=1 Tax=Campylobacter sp. RM16190 TaxID=1705727 RepID=UPI0014740EAD|nr:hypothetical protein [Campylobacter sp. RM16190]
MVLIELIDFLKANMNLEIYPHVVPNDGEYPCMVYQVVSELDRISLNAGGYQTDFLIQVDIYSKSYKQAQELKEKFKEALYSFNRPITTLQITQTKDEEYYRTMIEFEIFI